MRRKNQPKVEKSSELGTPRHGVRPHPPLYNTPNLAVTRGHHIQPDGLPRCYACRLRVFWMSQHQRHLYHCPGHHSYQQTLLLEDFPWPLTLKRQLQPQPPEQLSIRSANEAVFLTPGIKGPTVPCQGIQLNQQKWNKTALKHMLMYFGDNSEKHIH
jgi:hypothetical protein